MHVEATETALEYLRGSNAIDFQKRKYASLSSECKGSRS
jgi:hypothetical protein